MAPKSEFKKADGREPSHLRDPFIRRRAGLLLHPTSLPGPHDNGDLGVDAYRFVDYLQSTGASVWQMLPLGPTLADGSPYQCTSVHAGDYRLINIPILVEWGWLAPDQAKTRSAGERRQSLRDAYAGFSAAADESAQREYADFCVSHAHWLDDYALFVAIKQEHQGNAWWQWPEPLRDRDPAALAAAEASLEHQVGQARFEQFLFFRQWHHLRDYANGKGVLLFGDMPIFVAHDSAEVWSHRDLFALDGQGQLITVAGVPPDYFSATGQRWGNPHYRWDRLAEQDYAWWLQRFHTQLELFDLIRIDHFRGFEAYWEIPAAEETAINGRWVKGPAEAFFERLHAEFDPLPLVAEDLGVITAEVDALRHAFHLPGMRVLQFAFGSDPENPHLPHNYEPLSVVYTGTHDNDTTLGWYVGLAEEERANCHRYLGETGEDMPWLLIRTALASTARMAIVPMQDLLGLGSEHRMNTPGVAQGNWQWRFDWSQTDTETAQRMHEHCRQYGRLGRDA